MIKSDQDSIVQLFEFGMSSDDIAGELGLEKEAVELVVKTCSGAFRKAARELPKKSREIFSREQAEGAADMLWELSRNSLDERIRKDCSVIVLDEYMGRRDQKSLRDIIGGDVNITVINEHYKRAKKAYAEVLDV